MCVEEAGDVDWFSTCLCFCKLKRLLDVESGELGECLRMKYYLSINGRESISKMVITCHLVMSSLTIHLPMQNQPASISVLIYCSSLSARITSFAFIAITDPADKTSDMY